MVLGDEARGIALVKTDDMIDFVQQALKMANQKDKRTKTQKSEENTAGGNGDFYEKTLSG